MSWPYDPQVKKQWQLPETGQAILTQALPPVPPVYAAICAHRLRRLRDELRRSFVGLYAEDTGYVVDWLLATLLARENALLLGPPGVAKTQLAVRTFELLGLSPPLVEKSTLRSAGPDLSAFIDWWQERESEERQRQKYFHYLLSRFTQPEELFGPVEISLLRQGIFVRVNFGLLTGPGVYGAFLDEIFKGSGSILNTLLTLTQERRYFNWGGMVPSDLLFFIGASNEMPGGPGGALGRGAMGEDFITLHAFVDRFPVRLQIPNPSGTDTPEAENSQLAQATRIALERERVHFTEGAPFIPRAKLPDMPGINDLLLLGRALFNQDEVSLFEPEALARFYQAFIRIGANLRYQQSRPEELPNWTISPRKLKAIYKVALAHALVRDDGFTVDTLKVSGPGPEELMVFSLIWDSPVVEADLRLQLNTLIADCWR